MPGWRCRKVFSFKASWVPHRHEVEMLQQSPGAAWSTCFGAGGPSLSAQHRAGCGLQHPLPLSGVHAISGDQHMEVPGQLQCSGADHRDLAKES